MQTCEAAETRLAQLLITYGLVTIPSMQRANELLQDAKKPRPAGSNQSEFEEVANAIFLSRVETPGLAGLLLYRGRHERDERTQLSLLRGALRCICQSVIDGQSDELFVEVRDQVVETPCGLLMADEDLALASVV